MQYLQFSIYDRVSGLFGKPFLATNVRLACRMCRNLLNEENDISRNPSDYSLHCLGTFDESSGTISSIGDDDKELLKAIHDDIDSTQINIYDELTVGLLCMSFGVVKNASVSE